MRKRRGLFTEISLPHYPAVFTQTSILFKMVQLYELHRVEMTKDDVYKEFTVWYLISGQNAVFLEFYLISEAKLHKTMNDTKAFQSC